MSAPAIHPSAEQLQQFAASPDDGEPIVMINLLRFREQAAYPEGFEAAPCTGPEAYQRYAALVVPFLESVGAELFWGGRVEQALIAPPGESWDEALLVRYPSRSAFTTMVQMPSYQEITVHRTAALADSRLLMTHKSRAPG